MQDVIYAIYGKDIASSILDVDYTYEDIHVTGVVGKPEIARSNRSNQLFFVNQRFVKDKTATNTAVIIATETQMPNVVTTVLPLFSLR